MKRLRTAALILYLGLAVLVWIGFVNTPHDGLANAFLALYVLPYTLFGLVLTKVMGREAMVLMPTGFGYLAENAAFFVPGVIFTAALTWWMIGKVAK